MLAGLISAMALAAYVRAAHRLARPWPPGRTACFAIGCVTVALAALALDDVANFTRHVAQHLLLGMVAPALLSLGAPVTLVVRSVRPAGRRRILRLLHAPAVVALTYPVAVWALFGGSLFALYFTPLYRLSVDHAVLHETLHLHFLVVGALFFWPVVGVDPTPRRLPHGARLAMVFLAVPFHAVLGMALLGASAPMPGVASLGQQRSGAGLLWAGGDLLGLLAVLIVAVQWAAHDERQAVRADRRADAEGGAG
ncbi:MAG: cytochrome c oxidase assembly protein [Acidimicrobiales bacterium]